MAAQRPAYTWEQHKAAFPDTMYDHMTYCAGSFNHREAGKAKEVGDVFTWEGIPWRIVKLCLNPFAPIFAVPATWPGNYWESAQ